VNDNLIPNRKSLREILPKSATRKTKREPMPTVEPSDDDQNPNQMVFNHRQKSLPKKYLWLGGALLVVLLIFGGSFYFTSVKAIIVPKQAKINIDNTVLISSTASGENLKFDLITKTLTAKQTVPASGEEEVQKKASGQIIIYNDHSSNDQRLVTNTRFETETGLIYQITDPVVVPGQTTTNGETKPGQITVTVTAEEAGEDYNLAKASFTIPGFENTDLYNNFYAETEGPIAGGLIGQMKIISEANKNKAQTELETELKNKLKTESVLEIPETHIALSEDNLTSFSLTQEGTTEATSATLVGELKVMRILINKADLASYLASRYVPDYKNEPIEIQSYDDISITLINQEDLTANNLTNLEVDIKGQAHLVWVLDEERLKESLGGLNKNNYVEPLADFPALLSIQLKFMPPWFSTIPSNPKRISIIKMLNE